jgi:type II secretory ATPase GspE/PulE/Tfp pilus assembly ATPase PilB-like protein
MPDTATLSGRVLDALISAGLVTAEQVRVSEASAADTGANPGQVLVQRDLVTAVQIANVLEEELGVPRVDLESYAPDESALKIVPGDIARKRNIIPLFEIEGMLTVAIGDPIDVFELDALAAELGVEVEAVIADAPAVAEAIVLYYGEAEAPAETEAVEVEVAEEPSAEPVEEPEAVAEPEGTESEPPVAAAPPAEPAEIIVPGLPGFPDALGLDEEISIADFFEVEETAVEAVEAGEPAAPEAVESEAVAEPVEVAEREEERGLERVVEGGATPDHAIDLDVLAVADDRKVAVLVADILDYAADRGATRIHLLPYKAEFFLVFRVAGRLEKIASAPLSMQGALIDGLKSYVRLTQTPSGQPAMSRIRAEIRGKEHLLTTSVVPTLAGQRVVIALGSPVAPPESLVALGMNETEERALYTMVERGKGLVLIASPIGGGRSTTYYALLSHAARAGRIAYSVEEAAEHEIPSVAQVLVGPGSTMPAAAYFSAGMHQDTDVLAMDSLHTVEDVRLAVEAAARGKLVIATFAGGSIAAAVRRMLDLGAEPVSLANALTLAVGQRVARTNCPSCSVEQRSPLAERIPGAVKGMTARSGSGCEACGKSGFIGAIGLFEVLPFTEPVRAAVARSASAEELSSVVRAAGMRDMTQAGLDKVKEGLVSPEELDRVLRFSE